MQSKAKKNGKYPSKNKASPIDFETQISLRTYAPPKRSPSKKAFEKYKPRGLFSEFYGNLLKLMLRCCIWIILGVEIVHFQQVLWRSVLLEKVWNSLYIRKVCRANKGSGTNTSSCANLFMTENIIETWIQVLHNKNWNMILAEMTPRTSRLPVNWVNTSVTHKEKSKGVFTEGYPENIISYYSSAFATPKCTLK